MDIFWNHTFQNLVTSHENQELSFSNRERLFVREPVSFWREKDIAVIILLQVFLRTGVT